MNETYKMNSFCNITEYDDWYNEEYKEELSKSFLLALSSTRRKDKEIWHIMDFINNREKFFAGDYAISNGQVMKVAGELCRQSLSDLRLDLAGQHGPISDRSIHDVMCSVECSLNDMLRLLAMNVTRCECSELSLSQGNLDHTEGSSFCKESSGDYLCSNLGDCGSWQCAISDYGCKRHEYNQRNIVSI